MLYRRAPRTKASIDRTSSRQSIIDSTPSHDHQENTNNKEDNDQNQLDLTDSTLRQCNDVITASTAQDDSTVSFDDDDSDEYAYLILHRPTAFFFLLLLLFFTLPCTVSAVFCFAWMLLYSSCSSDLSGAKHELKVRLITDKVCDEVLRRPFNLFQHLKKKNKKCKKNHLPSSVTCSIE